MKTKRKIALIGPNFFSYIQAIKKSIADRGYEAEFFDERHSNSLIVKILYRIGYYVFFEQTKRTHLDKIAQDVATRRFTDVLLIDVEVTDAAFVRTLKASGIKVHLYMWDSADNKPRFTRYLSELDGKSSFDPVDCSAYGLTYIPLFAEDVFSEKTKNPPATQEIDMSFCGTLHSDRSAWLKKLGSFSAQRSLSLILMLYYHSRWLLLLLSVFHPSNLLFLFRVSTRGFQKTEIASVFAKSKCVFDLPHPRQRGLTARTFEALRSGSRLITSNRQALSLPGTLTRRIIIIDKVEDLEKIDFSSLTRETALTAEEDYFLSLKRFTDQILSVMGIHE